MRCSNRKLLIVFEGSAQHERTIGPGHIQPSTYTNVATYPLGKYKQCHSQHSEQCVCTGGNDTYAYVHRQGSLTGIRKPQY